MALFRFLTGKARQGGFRADAEDLASEAVARTIAALGPKPSRSTAVVWSFATTTCQRLLVNAVRNAVRREVSVGVSADHEGEAFGESEPETSTGSRGKFLRR